MSHVAKELGKPISVAIVLLEAKASCVTRNIQKVSTILVKLRSIHVHSFCLDKESIFGRVH